MKEVTKDMIIGDMLAQDMSIAAILMNAGMHLSLIHISEPTRP